MLRGVYADDVRLGERVHQRLATRAEVVTRLECWNEFGLRAAHQVLRRLKDDLAIPSGVPRLGLQEMRVDEVSGCASLETVGLPELKGGEFSPGRDPAPSHACVFLANHGVTSLSASAAVVCPWGQVRPWGRTSRWGPSVAAIVSSCLSGALAPARARDGSGGRSTTNVLLPADRRCDRHRELDGCQGIPTLPTARTRRGSVAFDQTPARASATSAPSVRSVCG